MNKIVLAIAGVVVIACGIAAILLFGSGAPQDSSLDDQALSYDVQVGDSFSYDGSNISGVVKSVDGNKCTVELNAYMWGDSLSETVTMTKAEFLGLMTVEKQLDLIYHGTDYKASINPGAGTKAKEEARDCGFDVSKMNFFEGTVEYADSGVQKTHRVFFATDEHNILWVWGSDGFGTSDYISHSLLTWSPSHSKAIFDAPRGMSPAPRYTGSPG